jgi:hypothetical protein
MAINVGPGILRCNTSLVDVDVEVEIEIETRAAPVHEKSRVFVWGWIDPGYISIELDPNIIRPS